jgi:elongation factor P
MPKASEIKRGDVVEIEGVPHVLKHLETKSPSSRGAVTLYKFRFKNLLTGLKKEVSSKGEEQFGLIDCQRVSVQFSYVDGDEYHFMDLADYTQYSLNRPDLEDQLGYLKEGLDDITALIINSQIAAIEVPQVVTLLITETAPGLKGASASSRTKPAMLETGLVVQVPEYISNGELVKVNTTNAKFMSRA